MEDFNNICKNKKENNVLSLFNMLEGIENGMSDNSGITQLK